MHADEGRAAEDLDGGEELHRQLEALGLVGDAREGEVVLAVAHDQRARAHRRHQLLALEVGELQGLEVVGRRPSAGVSHSSEGSMVR